MQSLFDPGRLLVISPHLDDAALGCAMLLTAAPQACVLNVFSGPPAAGIALTAWDRDCGFSSSRQAMLARREEDAEAMRVLGVEWENLDFMDSQYAPLPGRTLLAQAMLAAIDRWAPDTVLTPLGLHHCDHERVRDAALVVRQQRPDCLWIAYEEVPYRQRFGVMQQLLGRLARRGVVASPVACALAGDAERKAQALQAYKSQLRSIGMHAGTGDAEAAEGYWLLFERTTSGGR
jgi:LmbE family N-acetylglucosaminyl deacetylase